MEEVKYITLVVSDTYDAQRLVKYPEKVAIPRTYTEIKNLILNGHVVEVRDEWSNVVVDNLEKLDQLYKPVDYVEESTPVNVGDNSITTEVNSKFIKLPNGMVLDVESLMTNQTTPKDGYNIPSYLQGVPNVIPKATVEVELNSAPSSITPPPTPEPTSLEENKAEEEVKTEEKHEEEQVEEEKTTEVLQKGKDKKNKGDDK